MIYIEAVRCRAILGHQQSPQCEGDNRGCILFTSEKPKCKEGYEAYGAGGGDNEKLKLYVGDQELHSALLQSYPDANGDIISEKRNNAELIIEMQNEKVVFFMRNIFPYADPEDPGPMPFLSEIGTWILSSFNSLLPDCLVDRPTSHAAHDWGTNRLCQTVDRNDVSRVVLVIEAAVHYFRHLRSSTPRVSELQLRSGITVEFLLLDECEEVDPDTTLKLIVPDKTGKNLLVNGEVTVLANETRLYGIKITSSLKHLLHCSVFFFDSDFSVSECLSYCCCVYSQA